MPMIPEEFIQVKNGLRAGVEMLGRGKLGTRKPVFPQIFSLPLIFAEQSFRKHWKLIA